MAMSYEEKSPEPKPGERGGSTATTLETGFVHIGVYIDRLRAAWSERRQVGGIPARFVAPCVESRASVSNAAPLVEETFVDALTGRELTLAEMMEALGK